MVTRFVPTIVFVAIFVAHALYVGACTASAPPGWRDFGMSATVAGPLGLGAYWQGQDYFIGFSYALGASFAAWALIRCISFRQARVAAVSEAENEPEYRPRVGPTTRAESHDRMLFR